MLNLNFRKYKLIGILTKRLNVLATGQIIKYYEDKGYVINKHLYRGRMVVKRGTKINIDIKDLSLKSGLKVEYVL